MSDVPVSNQQAAAGQPQNASPEQGGAAAGQQTPYLTRDETLALVREELRKTSQSITDRVTSQVQKVMDTAKAQGITMTPQQAEAVLKATEAHAKPQPGPATPPANQPAQADPQQGQPPAQVGQQSNLDPVSAKAVTILKAEFGLTDFDPDNVDESEPEFALLDMETDDPEKFFASVREYGKAKKTRLASAGDPAALPGLGSGGQAANNFDGMKGRDILAQGYKR